MYEYSDECSVPDFSFTTVFFCAIDHLTNLDYCVRDAMKSSLIIKQHVEPQQVIIVQGTRD